MRITSMSVRILAAAVATGVAVAFADPYQWGGGDGRWGDSTMWSPNGVPGTAAGDVATFQVGTTQTTTVDADAFPFRIVLDTVTQGARQTFSIAPGNTLSLDELVLRTTEATDLAIGGGGTLRVEGGSVLCDYMDARDAGRPAALFCARARLQRRERRGAQSGGRPSRRVCAPA